MKHEFTSMQRPLFYGVPEKLTAVAFWAYDGEGGDRDQGDGLLRGGRKEWIEGLNIR